VRPARLRVEVGSRPVPALLRPAIAARLAGLPAPPGPEGAVAEAVAAAVAARRPDPARPEGRWR
jgi:hypothetical protein